ncbi:DUF3267 domain-containing protein [Halopiger djelfimassiliensis]|uniref:DUF3267 domain-containing protein n=1 Tax=Halopiger djelfimassiliensis TaxID=1293047 RepID=UPI000677CB85|nr:DUF3267 domain-containing protein [Halopiger djelfimassiliensis]
MSRTDPESGTSRQSTPLAEFRCTRPVAFQWLVVSVVGFFVFAYGFGHALAALQGRALEPIVIAAPSPAAVAGWLALSCVLVGPVVVLHETLHGVFMARYGGEPGYGFGVSYFVLPYAYAETEGTSYTRTQMLVILLAPVVGITTLGLAAMVAVPSPVLIVPLAANAAGSIGDLWMAGALLQYPSGVRVAGLPDADVQGFGIYPEPGRRVDRLPGAAFLSTIVSGAVGTLAVLVTGLLGLVLGSLAVGSGTVVLGNPNGRWFLFRHVLYSDGSVSLEIGDALAFGLATLGGIGWGVVAELRTRLEWFGP